MAGPWPNIYPNTSSLPVQGPETAADLHSRRVRIESIRPLRKLALGTAFMVGLDPEGPIQTLHAAWREGFDYSDTAPLYGDAEEILGQALAGWAGDRPVVATKTRRSTDVAAVRNRFLTSRKNLGDIDLLAVHDATPDYAAETIEATCAFLKELLEQRTIRAAGLGGGGPETQAQWQQQHSFRYVITHLRLDAVSLQGLHDSVPQANHHGAAVVAASPMHRGLFGPRHPFLCENPPVWLAPVFVRRAMKVNDLAMESGIPLSQLAVRFVLSMPFVGLVLTGAKCMEEWEDVLAAYLAGPLPPDLYAELWKNAQAGEEPLDGG